MGADALRDAAVVYIGDNLGMSLVMSGWWAKDKELCRELQSLYALCMKHGIEFLVEWHSRETPLLRLADSLGKEMAMDNIKWALCRKLNVSLRDIRVHRWPSADHRWHG